MASPLLLPSLIVTGGLLGAIAYLSANPLHVVTDVRPRLGRTPDERAEAEEARADAPGGRRPFLRRRAAPEPSVSGVPAFELRRGKNECPLDRAPATVPAYQVRRGLA